MAMRHLLPLAVCCFIACVAAMPAFRIPEILPYDPVAAPTAVIISGNARFTILTPRLVRMEWAHTAGQFQDKATLAIVNRNVLPVPTFAQSTQDGVLTINTASIRIAYTVGQPFSATTLTVTSVDPTSAFKQWAFGDYSHGDSQNLLGTIRSLDLIGPTSLNCTQNADINIHDESLHCQWGLISRSGWAVIDDADNYVLDPSSGWWDGPNNVTVEHDLYLLAHGHDYRGALADFILIGGKIAMTPRYALGIWWTRWFNFNTFDISSVVDEYRTRDLPLDVFVLDMDWHTKNAWGGWSWDTRLFPYPADALADLKRQGLAIAVNVHDADGVLPSDTQYARLKAAMGVNTTEAIPMSMIDPNYLINLEDIVLQALKDDGVDFTWPDWQQGGTQGGCAGDKQNPTFWINRVRCLDNARRGINERSMVLARWGGLGNHRYQVGFSGDVADLTWPAMAYQPYFSITGTNVGYGQWSHDIVGPPQIPELYVRWVQWAAYSAVFRSHERGGSAGECADNNPETCWVVRLWNVPLEYAEANAKAVRKRASLLPYIYTLSRVAYDSGLGPLRPMYYDFPESEMAYAATMEGAFGQYMFGDDLLVSPVVSASDPSNSMTAHDVWLPPGSWVELETSVEYLTGSDTAGKVLHKAYHLDETPVFVRAGAVIPSRVLVAGDSIGLAERQTEHLVFTVYPGAFVGSCQVYEDDGMSMDYLTKFGWTLAKYVRTGTQLEFTATYGGNYPGMVNFRYFQLRIVSVFPPTSVMVNGNPAPYQRFEDVLSPAANGWTYIGEELTLVIQTTRFDVTQGSLSIVVTYPAADTSVLSGAKGAIMSAIRAKRNLDQARITPGSEDTIHGALDDLASTGSALAYLAGKNVTAFMDLAATVVSQALPAAITEISKLAGSASRVAYSQSLLANAVVLL